MSVKENPDRKEKLRSSFRTTSFLLYINDLPGGGHLNVKLFTGDTFLFSEICGTEESTTNLIKSQLVKMQDWVCKDKINFNSDRTKQAQEVMFSIKTGKCHHSSTWFNNDPIKKIESQKYLELTLNEELSFTKYINDKVDIKLKGDGFFCKLRTLLLKRRLLTIHKF